MRLKVWGILLALGGAMALPASGFAGFDEGVRALRGGKEADAAKEFRAAAEAGNAAAQYNLGIMHLRGSGVPKDQAAGLAWLAKAADNGDVSAMSLLGALYLGRGEVAQDFDKALRYLKAAAGHGDAIAQNNLAVMYLYGWGTPVDRVTAYHWAARAERGGLEQAAALRQAIAAQITPDELASAERRIAEASTPTRAATPVPPPAAPAPAESSASGSPTGVEALAPPAAGKRVAVASNSAPPEPQPAKPPAPAAAPPVSVAPPSPPAEPPATVAPEAAEAAAPPPTSPVPTSDAALPKRKKAEPAANAAPPAPKVADKAPSAIADTPATPPIRDSDAPASHDADVPPARAAAPASTGSAAVGKPATGFRAHLASVHGQDAAEGEWKRLNRIGKNLLSGLTPTYEEVDLGDKGRYVRIYAGAFNDLAAAQSFCDSLVAANLKCRPVRAR